MSKKEVIITLEEAGWKRVCPLSESYVDKIEEVLEKAGYHTEKTDKYLLCQPLIADGSPYKKLIYISSYLDKDNYHGWNEIIDSQRYLSDNPFVEHHISDVADPENMATKFLEREGIESFKALSSLASVAHPSKILNVLKECVVPTFFEKHSKGKIYFIKHEETLHTMNSVARVLSDADVFGMGLFAKSKDIKREVPRSMRGVHQPGIDPFIESTLKIILSGFFPLIYGFLSSRMGGYLLFLLDKPLKIPPKKSPYQYFIEGGIFDDIEGRKSIDQLLDLIRKDELDYKEAYRRYVHRKEFSPEEMNSLISWTIDQLNDYYIKILDFCNFHNDKNFIDFSYHRKIFLTVERIFLEINNIVFTLDTYLRKILYFDLHDKVSNLMVARSLKRQKVFKRLLRLSHFNGKIEKVLQSLPAPFDEYIINYGDEIYQGLINNSVRYIWDKTRKSAKGIKLREIKEGSENEWIGNKFEDTRTKIPHEEYAVNLLHEFRNTLHGYKLFDYKYEQYLSIHEGIISDYLPDLSLIWLFVMLSDINGVLNSEITKIDY